MMRGWVWERRLGGRKRREEGRTKLAGGHTLWVRTVAFLRIQDTPPPSRHDAEAPLFRV